MMTAFRSMLHPEAFVVGDRHHHHHQYHHHLHLHLCHPLDHHDDYIADLMAVAVVQVVVDCYNTDAVAVTVVGHSEKMMEKKKMRKIIVS